MQKNKLKLRYLSNNVKIYLISFFVFLAVKMVILIFILKKSTLQTHDSVGYLTISRRIFFYFIERPDISWELSLTRTPGYPIFLSLLNSSIKAVIISQIILHLCISLILIILIKKLLNNHSPKIGVLVFVVSQIETSLFIYSYRILSEILFAFLVILFIFLLSLKHTGNTNKTLDLITLITLASLFMVRPVAVAFFIIFIFMTLFSGYRKLYIKLLIFSLLFIGSYCFYNKLSTGVLTYSTIQNHNLLFWEGAGAKSISESVNLKSVQQSEELRKINSIGNYPSLAIEDRYNGKRGLELIFENKISFLLMHILGAGKILFGPNRYEIIQLFEDSGRFNLGDIQKQFIVLISFLVTSIISLLGLFGSIKYINRNASFKLATITLFSLLLISGGPQAYGRFRAPISPILIMYALVLSFDAYRYWRQNKPRVFAKFYHFLKN